MYVLYIMAVDKTEHVRQYLREWRRANPDYHREWRRANPDYDREWLQAIYGTYVVYFPRKDQFKFGFGGVRNRLGVYHVTDPDATLVAFKPFNGAKAWNIAARAEEHRILSETRVYCPNGHRGSEMRVNVQAVRDYILDNFEEILDSQVLERSA